MGAAFEPDGFVVLVGRGDRIHFLDWGGPDGGAPVVLVPGLSSSAWIWAPVARRLRERRPVVAMDLRGHGLSDAPTEADAYELDALADDVIAVAEGSGALGPAVVLAGHGFGAIVAAAAAARLGDRCTGLVLVDGGWFDLEAATGLDVDEFLRGLDEPPEVMASMTAFLADRAGFDPATWDADQERAARATVVETQAGRLVSVTRPHVLEACVRTMFDYDPVATLTAVAAPVTVLVAGASGDDEPGATDRALAAVDAARAAAGRSPLRVQRFARLGHNLMRYRPDAVASAIESVAVVAGPGT